MTYQYESKRMIHNIISKEKKYGIGVLGVHGNRNDVSRENPVGARKKHVRLVRWLVDSVITCT